MSLWWSDLGARGAPPSLNALTVRALEDPALARAWDEALGVADSGRRARRLAWAAESPAQATPDWPALLREAFGDDADACAARYAAAESMAGDWCAPEAPLPFAELLLPLATAAARRVAPALAVLPDEAWRPLRLALLGQLSRVACRLLYAHFSAHRALRRANGCYADATPDAGYRAWIGALRHGGMQRLLRDYPVAARLLGLRAWFWGEMAAEFAARLVADGPTLAPLAGRPIRPADVARVVGTDSDSHNGGRQVLIVHLHDGTRLVYKPRSLALEALHGDLLAWAAARDPRLVIRSPRVVDRGQHGWMEFIAPAPVSSALGARRFYERAGALLALYYAIGASDLHFENVVAAGEDPVVIDLEMLLAPDISTAGQLPGGGMGTAHQARHALADSVLRTALLPMLKVSAAGDVVDVAGLATSASLAPSASAGDVPMFVDVGTDAMRLVRHPAPAADRPPHAPVLDGRCIPATAHVDALLAGFDRMYRVLAEHGHTLVTADGPIARAAGAPVRVLLRATSLYAQLAERTSHPEYLRDPLKRRAALEVLARPLLALDARPPVLDALERELAALEQLDIPCFVAAADSLQLRSADGVAAGQCLEQSALERTRARLAALSEADRRHQGWIIRSALGAAEAQALRLGAPSPRRTDRPAATAPDPLRGALQLAEQIAGAAVGGGAAPLWHAVVYDARARRFQVGLTPLSWLDGTLGIAAFLAEAGEAFDREDFRELAAATWRDAESVIDELRRFIPDRPWVDVGAATGLGSAIAGLSVLSGSLGAAAPVQSLETLRRLVDDAIRRRACGLDYTAGHAGAVVGALVAWERTGDPQWREAATAWGAALLERLAADGAPEALGFAHGVDGIAFALRRLAGATGAEDAAGHATMLEAAARRRWRQSRAGLRAAERDAAWSHGATGLLLARLAALDGRTANQVGRTEVLQDIARLLPVVQACLGIGSDDLCCGRAGRAEALSLAAEVLGAPMLEGLATGIRDELARRVHARAPLHLPGNTDHPALLTGRAGIGHTLLRAGRPGLASPYHFAGPPPAALHLLPATRPCTASSLSAVMH